MLLYSLLLWLPVRLHVRVSLHKIINFHIDELINKVIRIESNLPVRLVSQKRPNVVDITKVNNAEGVSITPPNKPCFLTIVRYVKRTNTLYLPVSNDLKLSADISLWYSHAIIGIIVPHDTAQLPSKQMLCMVQLEKNAMWGKHMPNCEPWTFNLDFDFNISSAQLNLTNMNLYMHFESFHPKECHAGYWNHSAMNTRIPMLYSNQYHRGYGPGDAKRQTINNHDIDLDHIGIIRIPHNKVWLAHPPPTPPHPHPHTPSQPHPNPTPSRQNGRNFADDIFICFFVNCILSNWQRPSIGLDNGLAPNQCWSDPLEMSVKRFYHQNRWFDVRISRSLHICI